MGKSVAMNDRYFEVLNSTEKAYFLGLVHADGSLRHRQSEGYELQMVAKTEDDEILFAFKEAIGSTSMVRRSVNRASKTPSKTLLRSSFSVCRKAMYLDLVSLNAKQPNVFKSIPQGLKWSFLRGVFDGNGCISERDNGHGKKYPRWNLCSPHFEFLQDVADFLADQGATKRPVKPVSTIFDIGVSRIKDLLLINAQLYIDRGVCLKRKQLRMCSLLSA